MFMEAMMQTGLHACSVSASLAQLFNIMS